MCAFEYLSVKNGKQAAMVKTCPLVVLAVLCLFSSVAVDAGLIEDRVQRHVEAAVQGGLTPTDYHHLVFAFSWRTTLEDWTLAERGLDRLAAVRSIDPLMVDEVRLIQIGRAHV